VKCHEQVLRLQVRALADGGMSELMPRYTHKSTGQNYTRPSIYVRTKIRTINSVEHLLNHAQREHSVRLQLEKRVVSTLRPLSPGCFVSINDLVPNVEES
jgi:hypothetical protein